MATSPVHGDLPLFTLSEREVDLDDEFSELDEFSDVHNLLAPRGSAEPPFVCGSCEAIAGYYSADYQTVCCPNCGGDASPMPRSHDSLH